MSKTVYGVRYSVSEMQSATLDVVFTEKNDAEKVAKGLGWYGDGGTVFPIAVYTTAKEYTDGVDSKDREALLQKLSDREKRLLKGVL